MRVVLAHGEKLQLRHLIATESPTIHARVYCGQFTARSCVNYTQAGPTSACPNLGSQVCFKLCLGTMTKTELLSVYGVLRQFVDTTLISLGLLATCETPNDLATLNVKLGDLVIPLGSRLKSVFPEGQSPSRELRNNFLLLVVRTAFKEAFQALRLYANQTDQWFGALERQNWFQFLRMVRNSFEHSALTDARFGFTENDMAHNLPVSWRGKRLDAEMDGLEIDFSFFSPTDVITLLGDAEQYVRQHMR